MKGRWESHYQLNGKRRSNTFTVNKYRKVGMGFEEASNLAYEAAVAHRHAIEASGTIRVGRGRPAKHYETSSDDERK